MTDKGRPRIESIDRFNVDTWLELNPKFYALTRELKKIGLPKSIAYLLLVRLFCLIAQHKALDGDISTLDHAFFIESITLSDDLSGFLTEKIPENQDHNEFLYRKLIDALISAKILSKDLKLVNWLENQPLLKARIYSSEYYANRRKSDASEFQGLSTQKNVKARQGKEKKGKDLHACPENLDETAGNVDNLPQIQKNQPTNLSTLSKKFINIAQINPKSNDATTIRKWITKLNNATDLTTTQELLDELQEAVSENRVENPVGLLINSAKKKIEENKPMTPSEPTILTDAATGQEYLLEYVPGPDGKPVEKKTPLRSVTSNNPKSNPNAYLSDGKRRKIRIYCPKCLKKLPYNKAESENPEITCPNCKWSGDKYLCGWKPKSLNQAVQQTLNQLKPDTNSPE